MKLCSDLMVQELYFKDMATEPDCSCGLSYNGYNAGEDVFVAPNEIKNTRNIESCQQCLSLAAASDENFLLRAVPSSATPGGYTLRYSGLILDHQHFGSYLDGSKRTIDEGLERKNFQKAGEIPAEIWSAMKIDSHPVVAEFVPPENLAIDEDLRIDEYWYAAHVKESQYFLQVME
ncbi:hypothetical protein QAD02_021017 [Eretmocerus hayati]|uniref:Uncharacterized protein n=1 Tax=Eretmocerus hayati TaxID=131215 RepID=A0ACC2PNQ5_9HYME|nr:hypothetical protein QAD02_021017 [Eretmocerus hayati]